MNRNEVYAKVTANIVAALEAGDLSIWRKPWRELRERGVTFGPVNAVTRKQYRGINFWALLATPYVEQRWLTFKQAQACGGHVRKGERGTQVIFWQPRQYTKRDHVTGEEESRNGLLVRYYTVFNVAQCEGLKLPEARVTDAPPPVAPTATYAELAARCSAVTVYGGDSAFYRPMTDSIHLPKPEQFTRPDAFTATGFHELTHWSGNVKRLARDFTGRFGDAAYATEELVAELGAAFLCAHYGVDGGLEQHASYLKHWLQAIKDDPGVLVTAASKAQAAAEFIIGGAELADELPEEEVAAAA